AVSYFMRSVGTPAPARAFMRILPVWRKLTGVAHTLPHDWDLCLEHQQGRPLPPGLYDGSSVPTLVVAGGRSPAYMRNAQRAVAEAVPQGRFEELAGQTHMVRASALAALVRD